MLNLLDSDYDEIIAIQIGSDIYFGQLAIDKGIEFNQVDKLFNRAIFKLLAHLDLDPKWEEYSSFPTIFTWTQYKEFNSIPRMIPCQEYPPNG